MGNNYLEKSLKRFLKRKVKITLGLVISFLITGTVFAADIEYKDILTAEEWITGIGSKDYPELSGDTIKLENGIITISADNSTIDLSRAKGQFSTKIIEVLETMGNVVNNGITLDGISKDIQSLEGYVEGFGFDDFNVNKGVAIVDNTINANNNIKYNYGILIGGQPIFKNQIGYNYGIIYSTGNNIQKSTIGTIHNYGLITGTGQNGQCTNNGKTYNYGVIANTNNGGQYIGQNGEGFNYGIIVNTGQNGQQIGGSKTTGTGYNYGIIANTGNGGQHISGIKGNDLKSVGYNYGIIENTGNNGQVVDNGSIGINYGVIENTGEYAIKLNGEDNAAINYGVVKNAKGKFFNKGVMNYGIAVYTGDATINPTMGDTDDNHGVLLNKDYEAQDNGSAASLEKLDGTNNIKNADTETTYYSHNNKAVIEENLNKQHLTTVLSDNTNITKEDAIFTFGKEGGTDTLTLTDSTIVGYFANGTAGTLLNVNGNLTLEDTKINAVTDLGNYENVAAVNLNNGTLTQKGSSEIVGKIVGIGKAGYVSSTAKNQIVDISGDIALTNKEDATDISFAEIKSNNLNLEFTNGIETNTNKVVLNNAEINKINGSTSNETIDLTIDSIENVGDIILGKKDDILNIKGSKHSDGTKIINMGTGNDTFKLGFGEVSAPHKKEDTNTFDYKIADTENVILEGYGWHIGTNADILDGKDSGKVINFQVADRSSLHIDLNNNFGKGKVETSLDKMAQGGNLIITTGTESSTIKFVVGEEFNVTDKVFNIATEYDISKAEIETVVIFKAEKTGNNEEDIKITVKEASELGLGEYKGIYDAVLGELSENDELRDAVNYKNSSEFENMIRNAGKTAEAFYTTGYAVTKDITDTYMSVAEDFGRKAGKGEWLAYGKYINSDTEFDGGKASKGYDGDITGTVGMLEYGVSDVTSYGAVFGMGDTEVDINGGGKLDGDNTYFGAYIKHRTQNGIELTGNVGFTKSELDLNLGTKTTTGSSNYHIITDGTADADALTFSLKGKKDYRIYDSVILQPVAGVRYSFISQDTVESSNANFKMDGQDIEVFEGLVGGNVVKEFEAFNGKLSILAGAEFILTEINESDDINYTLYGQHIELNNEEDIAGSRVEGHIGAEYVHENGIGTDVKYEMIWTDKGDSSRITAGVSYKF